MEKGKKKGENEKGILESRGLGWYVIHTSMERSTVEDLIIISFAWDSASQRRSI